MEVVFAEEFFAGPACGLVQETAGMARYVCSQKLSGDVGESTAADGCFIRRWGIGKMCGRRGVSGIAGAIGWTTGGIDADVSANLTQVTPEADVAAATTR